VVIAAAAAPAIRLVDFEGSRGCLTSGEASVIRGSVDWMIAGVLPNFGFFGGGVTLSSVSSRDEDETRFAVKEGVGGSTTSPLRGFGVKAGCSFVGCERT
jgi:hypothetical protein